MFTLRGRPRPLQYFFEVFLPLLRFVSRTKTRSVSSHSSRFLPWFLHHPRYYPALSFLAHSHGTPQNSLLLKLLNMLIPTYILMTSKRHGRQTCWIKLSFEIATTASRRLTDHHKLLNLNNVMNCNANKVFHISAPLVTDRFRYEICGSKTSGKPPSKMRIILMTDGIS